MNKLILCANQYIREADWKLISLLKLCLLSLGICIGLRIPSRNKKTIFKLAAFAFMASYIPLMSRFIRLLCSDKGQL